MNKQKKEKSWATILGIIVVAVLIISAYFFSYILVFDKSDIPNSMRDIVSIYTCITAVITTLFSGINIVLTVKQHRENKQAAIFTRWYDELVLNRHLDKIKEFYSTCESLVFHLEELSRQGGQKFNAKYDVLVQQEVANPFTSKFTSMRKNLIVDLSIIDRDFSITVSNILQNLQDNFFEELTSPDSYQKYQKMHEIIKGSNNSIMKHLLEFNKDLMKSKRLSKWIDR